MTAIEARAIADETIRFWRRIKHRPRAHEVYRLIVGERYPGGGWERARMAMVSWLMEQDQEPEQKRAA